MLNECIDKESQNVFNSSEAVSSDASIGFGAVTPLGDIELVFIAEDMPDKIYENSDLALLQSAQWLGRAESLICLLEDWLGVGLDFSPLIHRECNKNYFKISLTFLNNSNDVVYASLYLPEEIIKFLSSPEKKLATLMNWDRVPCNTRLASVSLPMEQFEKLSVGSMLLIPESFELFWRCHTSLSSDPVSVFPSELDVPQRRFIFDYHEVTEKISDPVVLKKSTESITIEVMFQTSLSINVDTLLGWAETPVFPLEQSITNFQVVLNVSQTGFAKGDLVSIGGGYGVLVRSMKDNVA